MRAKEFCRACGVPSDGSNLSKRGLCERCQRERQTVAADQIRAKRGPIYEAWKAGLTGTRPKKGGATGGR